jgi:hypothetical protein
MEGEAEYIARNIFEACYLYVKSARLLTVIGTPGRAKFVFDDKDGFARRIAQEYVTDTAAPALSLFRAFGQLKKEADQALGPIHRERSPFSS